MTEVVLYHHVQGLTVGVHRSPRLCGRPGTPYTRPTCSRTLFDTIDEGMAFAREAGFGALAERGVAAAEEWAPASSTQASRSASCPPRSWRRPGPARAGPC